MVADYWIVRRGRVDVPSLYMGKQGRYYYTAGINWRALVALVVPIAPTLPGLAASVSPTTVTISDGLQNLFSVCWLFGFTVSVALYSGLSIAFPDGESHVERAILADDVPDLPTTAGTTTTNMAYKGGKESPVEDEKDDKDSGTRVRVEGI